MGMQAGTIGQLQVVRVSDLVAKIGAGNDSEIPGPVNVQAKEGRRVDIFCVNHGFWTR